MSIDQMKAELLKKHVGAVHINSRLSLLERKVANVLLLNAYDHLLTSDTHSLPVKKLAELCGFDSNDRKLLKQSLKTLAETSIEWNLLDEKGQDIWRLSTMLAEAEIRSGICQYGYSRVLRDKLYNPEVYARINLAIQRRFSSGYALALYENCVRFRGVRSTGWWPLELFRRLMGIEEKEYALFKDLNRRVIKPAVSQINGQSDILVEVEFRRESRRIVAIRFDIQDNPQLPLRLPVKEQILSEMDRAGTHNADELLRSSESPETVISKLVSLGLSEKAARRWQQEKDERYILENLAVVQRDMEAGKVDNLPAYATTALKEDFRSRPLPRRKSVRKHNGGGEAPRNSDNARITNRAIDDQRKDRLQQDLERALAALDKREKKQLELRFWQAHRSNTLIQRYRDEGLDHPVVYSVFRAFAAAELIGSEPSSTVSAATDAVGA